MLELTLEDLARSHVPYRDSKLTQILQPSLSGNARVSVVCTINPAARCVEDSKSTLKFAQRVKKVPVNAERNEIMDEKALIVKYQMHVGFCLFGFGPCWSVDADCLAIPIM